MASKRLTSDRKQIAIAAADLLEVRYTYFMGSIQ
jgi:hypothetical protein